jgi:recombination protein RecA
MALKRRQKSTGELASEIEEVSLSPVDRQEAPLKDLIPTGSVMLNLACSDTSNGGYAKGKIVNIIGDSSSGKTLLALSMLAEVSSLPAFDDYRLIFDDAEEALEFNLGYLFGEKAEERIELDITSNTVEDYYGNVLRALKEGEPFIYVLDSFDSITADAEIKRSKEYENKKEDKSGSYKTEKARMSSEILRVIKGKIKETDSLLLIISQTRDNIGFGAMFQPKVRAGGKALKFYCCHEIWLGVGGKEKKKGLEIGASIMAKVSKNKLTGKKRDVNFPVYYDYGVDDLTSCINFLIDQGVWTKSKQSIKSGNFYEDPKTMPKLLNAIEEDGFEESLFALVQSTWNDLEESIKLNRKRKYA